MSALTVVGDGPYAPASEQGRSLSHERRLDRAERDTTGCQMDVLSRDRTRAARLELAQALLVAAGVHDAAADLLDADADQRERALDLAQLLSRASDTDYGSDWPARRHAALARAQAHADRLSTRMDLTALVAAFGAPAVKESR